MSVQSSSPKHPGDGWRVRKRRETRRRIADAGLRLFQEHGFEATTLDAIAEAAGIARRTFFHYFDGKEALLYAYEDDVEDSFRAVIAACDGSLPPFKAMVLAVQGMIAKFDTERIRLLDTVAYATEALRAGKQANHQRLEDFLFSALVEKWPSRSGHIRLRLIAMIGIGVLRIAHDQWRIDPSRSLPDYADENFVALGLDLFT